MAVHDEGGANSWRATGFYSHPEASKRYISWELLVALKNQCDMPWVVFSDFNEITHFDEKLGWLDQDVHKKWVLWGQRFIWCNGRYGEQRTQVKLDQMVANEIWIKKFPKAQANNISMAASDHCLLALSLRKRSPSKPTSRRSVFEVMWVRDERCREVIELAWEPLHANTNCNIVNQIKSCQSHLKRWNQRAFGNVKTRLKKLKERLQFLEAQNLLTETASKIQGLKKEINKALKREEVMWIQRSRTL